jgi:hypothetical protein
MVEHPMKFHSHEIILNPMKVRVKKCHVYHPTDWEWFLHTTASLFVMTGGWCVYGIPEIIPWKIPLNSMIAT